MHLETSAYSKPSSHFPTIHLIGHFWTSAKDLLGITDYTRFTPIWSKDLLPEFGKLQGFHDWAKRGILTISHLCKNQSFKSFQQLQVEFSLDKKVFFITIFTSNTPFRSRMALSFSITDTPLFATIFRMQDFLGFMHNLYLNFTWDMHPLVDRNGNKS